MAKEAVVAQHRAQEEKSLAAEPWADPHYPQIAMVRNGSPGIEGNVMQAQQSVVLRRTGHCLKLKLRLSWPAVVRPLISARRIRRDFEDARSSEAIDV